MKKKLFAVAMLVSLYALFVFTFTAIDNKGNVTKFISDISFENSGVTSVSPAAVQIALSANDLKASFRDPMPPPLKKPKPRRKSRRRR